ncbi:MAG TPA: hypothetical protein VMX56_00445, partial [Anaerolineales bacterium]|nr:hypothetical protein [Anaerolineales bacterium]
MDEFIAVLLIIVGLLLRVGIPIGATAILVYALRRLDQRWQQEAEQAAQSEIGQPSIFSQIGCWVTHNCPQENRDKCPAFIKNNKPCWQVFRNGSGDLPQKCLKCPVFSN